MTMPNVNRELNALIARTKGTHHQIQSIWERFENLEAAIDSAKQVQREAKSLIAAGKKRRRDKTRRLENQARLIGKRIKDGIPAEEVAGLIRAADENRRRLQKAGRIIEDLEAEVDASQDGHVRRRHRRPVNKSKSKQRK